MIVAARSGVSGALSFRGDAGIGKTSLLEYAVESATDFEVRVVAGVQDEIDAGFGGLRRLLTPIRGHILERAGGSVDAALSAFGLVDGPLADRYVVGRAVLDVLAAEAEKRPVLCVVDDVQWLDAETLDALALVARRAENERLALLFAGRPGSPAIVGVPELELTGLPELAAMELLRQASHDTMDDREARRIVAQTGGSPMALTELASTLGRQRFAAMSSGLAPPTVSRRLEEHFRMSVAELPADTQTVLLVLAADTSGDLDVVRAAARSLGATAEAVGEAVRERILTPAPELRFRHPLIRSAIYSGASGDARRQAHRAIAEALVARGDLHRRTWHLAAAAPGLSEEMAAELDAAALQHADRGAHSAAAAFFARAAELSPDSVRGGERLLAAANAFLVGGDAGRARELLTDSDAQLADPYQRGLRLRLLGATRYALGEALDTTEILMEAAVSLRPFDLDLARSALKRAFAAARISGRFAPVGGRYDDVAVLSRSIPLPDEPSISDRLVIGQLAIWYDGHDVAVKLLRPCLEGLVAANDLSADGLLWLSFGCWSAGAIGADETLRALATQLEEHARARQAPESLSLGLMWLGLAELFDGSLSIARRHFAERSEILAAIGKDALEPGEMIMAAWSGREDETRAHAERLERLALELSHGWVMGFVEHSVTVLDLGLGNYRAAYDAATKDYADNPFLSLLSFPDLVEAAVRCGEHDAAIGALEELSRRAVPNGTPLSLGLLARCEALLVDGDGAEVLYNESIEQLSRCRGELQVARTRLVFGEWLRRRRRRTDAREQLRLAHQIFDAVGARAFAERARTELAATGAHARQRSVGSMYDLTSQETRVAELAATGATNAEIGATLYISAHTVGYHLGKVYRKLGVSSRRELAGAMG